jgi:hypothetical protein
LWQKVVDLAPRLVFDSLVDKVESLVGFGREIGAKRDSVHRLVELGGVVELDLLLVVQNDQVFRQFRRRRKRPLRLDSN